MMPRRAFVGTLAVALLAAPRRAHAQPPAKAPRVGWLGRSAGRESPTFKAFADGLRDLGYVIGENLAVDVRTPEQDKVEQYPDVAARLVAAGVDVILAPTPHALEAATKATKTIPIVGVDFESDPVAKGWVATLARPGGNVTGCFLDIPEMSGKQLQLLKEVKPSLARVAGLGDARVNELQFRATEVAAQGAGLTLQRLEVKDLNEIPRALTDVARQRTGALLVLSSPMIFGGMSRIAEVAVTRLPRSFSARRQLCGQDPQGGSAGRSAGAAPDEIRVRRQPQDRQGHRPQDPTVAAAARGSRRRMTGLGLFSGRNEASCTFDTIGNTMSVIQRRATTWRTDVAGFLARHGVELCAATARGSRCSPLPLSSRVRGSTKQSKEVIVDPSGPFGPTSRQASSGGVI